MPKLNYQGFSSLLSKTPSIWMFTFPNIQWLKKCQTFLDKVQARWKRFYPAFLPQECLAISTTSTMHKWAQSFWMNFCGSAQPFQKMVEVNSVGDRISSSRAVSSHSSWGQPESCWSRLWLLQRATTPKHSPSSPAPSRRGQGHNWCLSVTKCLMVLQWGTQHQVLSRQDNCCCNSLWLDTESSVGSRIVARVCSNKEASDRLEISAHQMHADWSMDASPTASCFCASAEWAKWPLWSLLSLLYQKLIGLFALFALGQVCKTGLVARKM